MPQFQGSCKQNISEASGAPYPKPYLFPAHTLTLLPAFWNFPQTTPNLFLVPAQYNLFWFSRSCYFFGSPPSKRHTQCHLFLHLGPGCSCLLPHWVPHALPPPRARIAQDGIVELGTTGNFHRILKDSALWLLGRIQKNLKLLIYCFVVFLLEKELQYLLGPFTKSHVHWDHLLTIPTTCRIFRFPYNTLLSCRPSYLSLVSPQLMTCPWLLWIFLHWLLIGSITPAGQILLYSLCVLLFF